MTHTGLKVIVELLIQSRVIEATEGLMPQFPNKLAKYLNSAVTLNSNFIFWDIGTRIFNLLRIRNKCTSYIAAFQ